MKTIAILAVLVLLGSGCVATRITTPKWTMTRASVFNAAEIPKLSVAPDGSVTMEGYANSAQIDIVKAAIEAAIAAGKKQP